MPLSAEEQSRFDRVPARRAGVGKRDDELHERADANREEQLEARLKLLRHEADKRDAAHQRVRERIAETDRVSKERMMTAEGRRSAILDARVASLREADEARALKGKQALEERRMVERGFASAYADVTVVATTRSSAALMNASAAANSYSAPPAQPQPQPTIQQAAPPMMSSSAVPMPERSQMPASSSDRSAFIAPAIADAAPIAAQSSHAALPVSSSAPAPMMSEAPVHASRQQPAVEVPVHPSASRRPDDERSVSASSGVERREKKANSGCFCCC